MLTITHSYHARILGGNFYKNINFFWDVKFFATTFDVILPKSNYYSGDKLY